ncbi:MULTISPECIES: DUF6825 family protein [Oscillatoriales]|jgi:polyhydroxyalkanoate synthesis regulator phasin|uniref:Thylakoid lumen protein n=4 Tax=Limnospira TaxID=2596745 RepID=A0A9P1KFE3_9CYAN|nr:MULTISPECIES: hypothetical protein [Oscillatoriales]AMW30423.1 hypothetical protein AP285_23280 [Arthrospira platensis YZ]KDR58549.1 hypothetical protein APPUASWS_004530 [Arthrospira platensis str. Paraca]MBD2669678.1 hypothetical protein [Arthrospira platensis FACHB-439]MBD2710251.1 hypothetical protein [Arthrospira platensis FACHB-835]MDC0840462.1 hypothetical protein [Limnoraphis robusta]MDF2207643.1 hypothetical protein [Arthrospira platensis NCB002]MDT9183848.1 hypothetical protein [
MSKPSVHSFFVGRALAEGLYEQIENILSNGLSELGKFDAEQREKLRDFTNQVIQKADSEAEKQGINQMADNSGFGSESVDLQETIDDLRAEIAQMRSELQRYRNQA